MEPTLSVLPVADRPGPLTPTAPGRATCLSPDGAFPAELTALPLVELQVLHSRIVCQLDREYLESADGPHPVTQDRHRELVAELGARAGR